MVAAAAAVMVLMVVSMDVIDSSSPSGARETRACSLDQTRSEQE